MKEKRQLKVNEYLRTFLFVKIRKNRIRFTVLRTFYFTKNCAQSSPLSKVFTIKKQNIIHRIKENCCSTNFQKKKNGGWGTNSPINPYFTNLETDRGSLIFRPLMFDTGWK